MTRQSKSTSTPATIQPIQPEQTAEQTAETLEAILHDKTDPTYLRAERLVRTGRVNDETTFRDLERILAVDQIEQRLSQDLNDWFDLYEIDNHTASEAYVALALVLLESALYPEYEDELPVAA